MSKVHSTFAESLDASSTLEMDETLLGQLDQLERINNLHRKNVQLRDRVETIDAYIQKCRQMMGVDDAAAALLHLKCLSLIGEPDKIVNAERNSVISNTNTYNLSSSNRIHPIEMKNFHPSNANPQRSNMWNNPIVQIMPEDIEKSKNEEEEYQYNYGYNKHKWWRILCMNSAKEAKEKDGEIRDLWNTQIEFFLSCLGFIVGVGNTVRFPSMIYQYGGIFLVPYIICLCVFGLPLVYLQLCIGQYSALSASGAFWKMMPAASGIGWALVLLAVPVAIYYNIIVAWFLYYLWFSIQGIFLPKGLPWDNCNPEWLLASHCCELKPDSIHTSNFTACYAHDLAMTAPEAFFHYQVLNRTAFKEPEFGDIQIHMVVCLAVAWILVFFGVFKGIGSIGWAVSITSTIPYLMLIILLLRGLSLKGSGLGINYMFSMDFRELWTKKDIWTSAAKQVFYELGIDAGPLISMASFSRYRNNIYRDAVLLVLIDTFTSILCGLVTFSFIGFLATEQGNPIIGVLKHDPLYLAFTVYPAVTSFMEWGFLWAALSFGMLALSALDAEFAWIEMIASAIMNQLGSKNRAIETRLVAVLCLVFFICGIPLCARGGIFIYHAIENLNANWNSFSLSLILVIIVCFIYGIDKFLENIREMLRIEKPPFQWALPGKSRWYILTKRVKYFFGPTGGYIKLSWCVFTPFILATLFLASIFGYEPIKFNKHYLPWGYEAVAWIAMIGPLFVVPFTLLFTIQEARKRRKPLLSIFSGKNWPNKPVEEEEHQIVVKEDEYMYIDPISREASAKSRNPQIDNQPTNEDSYALANDRIREWAERSSRNEPSKSIDIPSVATTNYEANNYEMDEPEADEENLYGRRKGRLRDLIEKDENNLSESSSSTSGEYVAGSERRSTVKRSPFVKSSAVDLFEEPAILTLFGPPPVQQRPDVFTQSISRIKTRGQRRSDQKKNRVFNNSFNLVVMDQTPGSSASNSGDRMPVPDRPEISERRSKIGSRKSTESGTNISMSPFDIDPSISTESMEDKETFPMTLTIPTLTLKRPKPIGNIPKNNDES